MTALAEQIVAALKQRGTRHIFGVPGGGSSLDLIEACGRLGVEFVLTRSETSAVLMAAASGELSGAPGAALTGVGPGAAAAMNGMAYASLERSPLVLLTDRIEPTAARPTWHQVYDQPAGFTPVSKAARWIRPDTDPHELAALLDLPAQEPQGPVHLDMVAAEAGVDAPAIPHAAPGSVSGTMPQSLKQRIAGARKPVMIVGLQARHLAGETRALAQALGAACLTTYKAKGVISDHDPLLVAQFTGGTAEAAVLSAADLVIMVGHDPIEMIPGVWSYTAPVVALSTWDWAAAGGYPVPEQIAVGDLQQMLVAVTPAASSPGWDRAELARLRGTYRNRIAYPEVAGISPDFVIDDVQRAAAAGTRLTVDAGAHMFPTLARWMADEPLGVMKSNGLSTMGYALPVAIASALHEPDRPVVAVTGDGGMMMCLPELATAAEHGLDITVIVLNDAMLSLIDVKQRKQQRPQAGVASRPVDFAMMAQALGCHGATVRRPEGLAEVLENAAGLSGPRLIDVHIDPSGYDAQLDAMRG
ncbi:MAG: thiamine pyrophosphate-binding protein [Minwuia sp.]|nr:thiamine pyrophosphate-binding protein [Minwuia sp.]